MTLDTDVDDTSAATFTFIHFQCGGAAALTHTLSDDRAPHSLSK